MPPRIIEFKDLQVGIRVSSNNNDAPWKVIEIKELSCGRFHLYGEVSNFHYIVVKDEYGFHPCGVYIHTIKNIPKEEI